MPDHQHSTRDNHRPNRALARARGKALLSELPRERVATIKAVAVLRAFEKGWLRAPKRPPRNERGKTRETTRLKRVQSVNRLCWVWGGSSLQDLLDGGSLVGQYVDRCDYDSATRKTDLDLWKRAMAKIARVRGGHFVEFVPDEKIPRGGPRDKPDLTREHILRIMIGAVGGLWDKGSGCWRTENDAATAPTQF